MTFWQSLIADLQKRGLTQAQIGSLCRRKPQATISDLVRGITLDPRHTLGEDLKRLHKASDRELARLLREAEASAPDSVRAEL